MLGRPLKYDPSIPLPPRKWIVEDLIAANNITFFSGDSGTGKSYIMLAMAMAIIRGEQWCGFDTMTWPTAPAGKVLYIDNENDEYEIQERLRNLGVTRDEFREGVRYFNRVGVRLGRDDWLERTLDEIENFQPSCIVIDTVSSVGAVVSNDGDSVTQFYEDVLRPMVSSDPGCGLVLMGHERKTPEGQKRDPRNAALGSGHWRSQADGMMTVARKGKLAMLLSGAKREFPLTFENVKNRGGAEFAIDLKIVSDHKRDANGKWRTVSSSVERRPS